MLTPEIIRQAVSAALQEDAPTGDITSDNLISADATATAILNAREPGVFSGRAVFAASFQLVDPSVGLEWSIEDGERFEAGQELCRVTGNARAILRGERIGLNFTQRMCGIATTTVLYVKATEGTQAKILDTRKTTPLLRAFEKYAVNCGGGKNHRFSLSDAVLVKDNHLAVLTRGGIDVTTALRQAKAKTAGADFFEVEVDSIEQIPAVLAAEPDVIMLDNFSIEELREGVALIAGRAKVEASGGVNLNTVRAIAQTGVDYISVGALTHHINTLDLGLDVEIH